MLNAAFESKLALEDDGYEIGSENFNIPTHSEKHPGSTSFPVLKMPLLTQFQLHHPVPEIHDSDLYAEDWHTAPQMMMTPQKMRPLSISVHHKCRTTHMIHVNYLPSTILMLIYAWKKKRISKLFHWIMNIGLPKKFPTDHCVYMNIHYHTDYAHANVHIQLTKPLLTMIPWI